MTSLAAFLLACMLPGLDAPATQVRDDVYVYHVDDGGERYDAVSLLPPRRAQPRGIPGVAILGRLRVPIGKGGDVLPDNVIVNRAAVTFLHEFIARSAPAMREAADAARAAFDRGEPWLNYIDGRTQARSDAAAEDRIGTFEIVDGRISAETYRPNKAHRVVSEAGVFRLDSILLPRYIDALSEQPVESPSAATESSRR